MSRFFLDMLKALIITYLVTSILPAPSSCVWRNAKCLRFLPTSCPGQKQSYAQLKHKCGRNPWFSLLLSATSVHLYAETTALAASGQMFATMVVLQLPPSESWSTGNWRGISAYQIITTSQLQESNQTRCKTNQRGQPNTQIERVR